MNLPHKFIKTNIYYLLQTPKKNIKKKKFSINFKKKIPPCISKISQNTKTIIKLPSKNKIYTINTINTSNNKTFLKNNVQNTTLKSKKYDKNSTSNNKIFINTKLIYSKNKTISFFTNNKTTTFTNKILKTKKNKTLSYIYSPFTKTTKKFHYTTNKTLTIYKIKIKINITKKYTSSKIYK